MTKKLIHIKSNSECLSIIYILCHKKIRWLTLVMISEVSSPFLYEISSGKPLKNLEQKILALSKKKIIKTFCVYTKPILDYQHMTIMHSIGID